MELYTMLEARLIEKADKLDWMSRTSKDPERRDKLKYKAQGVRLALSYLLEMTR
jgi:hypothetical protein